VLCEKVFFFLKKICNQARTFNPLFNFFIKKNKKIITDNERLNSHECNSKNCKMLIVADKILDNENGKIIADFVNYSTVNGVNVVVLCNRCDFDLKFCDNVQIFVNKFLNLFCFFDLIILFILCKIKGINVISVCNINLLNKVFFLKKKLKVSTIYWAFSVFDISTKCLYYKVKNIEKFNLIFSMSNEITDFLLDNFNIDVTKIKNLRYSMVNVFHKYNVSCNRVVNMIKNIDDRVINKKIFFCKCNYRDDVDYLKCFIKAISQININDYVCIFSGDFRYTLEERKEIIATINDFKMSEKIVILDKIKDEQAMYVSAYAILHIEHKYTKYNTRDMLMAGIYGKPSIVLNNNNGYSVNIIENRTGFCARYDNIFLIKNIFLRMLCLTNEEYIKIREDVYNYAKDYFNYSDNRVVFEDLKESILEMI